MSTTELIEKKTIGEVEHIVHASGEWDGTGPVEFSDDGETWTEAWAPTIITGASGEEIRVEVAHPEFARVEVYRKGVRIPTKVTIRWSEQYPAASEEWSGKWDRSPMRHLGRTVRMVAFRQTFRDLLGDIRIEEEVDERDLPTAPTTDAAPKPDAEPKPDAAPVVERDWAAEFLAATTIEEIDVIEKDARAVRAFTPDKAGTDLHRTARNQRKAIAESAWALDHTPEPAATLSDAAAEDAPATERPAPRDYLPPQNRAGRRAASRKKKGRR
ncbi:hypothetical protein [Microbacterium sp. Leaf320]|uniref:hypothetical protein n=1 Tax=Microbacterium sp. Leaf320 TaxID=1736334 RepID=UPI0006F30C54|nr:hypothetical protein [Microbacterium sp. Leaf320]KQQ65727.1 hypothetical protein ASF63_10225 [Microbacterium sp. Leaf320]